MKFIITKKSYFSAVYIRQIAKIPDSPEPMLSAPHDSQ